MALTPERRQYLADLANDEWVDRLDDSVRDDDEAFDAESEKMELETDRFLASVTDPEELHCFADLWNWDGGMERMLEVAEHPHCDAGTALMIYWRTDPEYYLKFADSSEGSDSEREAMELIETIEARYLGNAYASRRIAYDPRADGNLRGEAGASGRRLPAAMYEPLSP